MRGGEVTQWGTNGNAYSKSYNDSNYFLMQTYRNRLNSYVQKKFFCHIFFIF